VVGIKPPPFNPKEKPGTQKTESWMDLGQVWQGTKNLDPHRDSIPELV
jgi:hypothetical protein